MINPTFKQWLSLVAVIQETVPHVPRMNWQNCTSESVSYEYIGAPEKRVGSRIGIPEGASVIPFQAGEEQMAHIPNFKKVSP
ncbi:hypothetical protein [Brevibacillus brevis]|uniref:hypothetical protein n=1 Tax=Brevibacillus brevis TaxID=1393 RepID=UPI001157C45E|nr:hypothetical protein [Lysinibacillus sp. SDF0063]TQR37981.1 hypothetical protein C7Y45_08960 [Lysinibacillus sp. SDF0063]